MFSIAVQMAYAHCSQLKQRNHRRASIVSTSRRCIVSSVSHHVFLELPQRLTARAVMIFEVHVVPDLGSPVEPIQITFPGMPQFPGSFPAGHCFVLALKMRS